MSPWAILINYLFLGEFPWHNMFWRSGRHSLHSERFSNSEEDVVRAALTQHIARHDARHDATEMAATAAKGSICNALLRLDLVVVGPDWLLASVYVSLC